MKKFKDILKKWNSAIKNCLTQVKEYFKNHKWQLFVYIFLLVISIVVIECVFIELDKPDEVTYSEFRDDLESGKIDTLYYTASDEMMRYTLLNNETEKMSTKEREEYKYPKENWRMTKYPAGEDFRKEILEYNVNIVVKSFEPKSPQIIATVAGVTLPLLFFVWLLRYATGGVGSIDEKLLFKTTDIRFSDVIGHDEVISDLKYTVELLKDPTKGSKLGAQPPRGILFCGEPGTGKTLLAKAIAGESGVPFIYINASNFVELYVGVGAKRVRSIFKEAKKVAPCIIFIDEIDAIGKKRGGVNSHSEIDQTLDALLQEMDGFDTTSGIFVIAATNMADKLDKALVRSGRFDRKVVVAPPRDWKVRLELFEHYLKDTPKSETIDLKSLSKQTSGFTGADINSIVNESKLIAMMRDSDVVDTCDIEEAIDKKIFDGNRSKKEQYYKDKEIVAYHEAGHAVVTYLLGKPIARVSIIGSTSGVGGFVMQSESKSQFTLKGDLEKQVMISFGGRCSEAIKFDDISTGAQSDISKATSILHSYVMKYGFSKKFGMVDVDVLIQNRIAVGDEVASIVSDLSKELEEKTMKLLQDNYSLVEILADSLLSLETISGDDVKEILTKEV